MCTSVFRWRLDQNLGFALISIREQMVRICSAIFVGYDTSIHLDCLSVIEGFWTAHNNLLNMVSDCTLNNNAPFKCNEITKFVNLVSKKDVCTRRCARLCRRWSLTEWNVIRRVPRCYLYLVPHTTVIQPPLSFSLSPLSITFLPLINAMGTCGWSQCVWMCVCECATEIIAVIILCVCAASLCVCIRDCAALISHAVLSLN